MTLRRSRFPVLQPIYNRLAQHVGFKIEGPTGWPGAERCHFQRRRDKRNVEAVFLEACDGQAHAIDAHGSFGDDELHQFDRRLNRQTPFLVVAFLRDQPRGPIDVALDEMAVHPIAGAEASLDIDRITFLQKPEVRFRERLGDDVKAEQTSFHFGDGQANAIDRDGVTEFDVAPIRGEVDTQEARAFGDRGDAQRAFDNAGEHAIKHRRAAARNKRIAVNPMMQKPGEVEPEINAATNADADTIMAIVQERARWLSDRDYRGSVHFERQASGLRNPQWQLYLKEEGAAELRKCIAEGAAGGFYVARCNGHPVGTFRIQWDDEETWGPRGKDALAGYIHTLATPLRVKGIGMGAVLTRAAEQIIAERGRTFARLDCWVKNSVLVEYYSRLGYSDAGQTIHSKLFEKRVRA
jgi:hypothetical protein